MTRYTNFIVPKWSFVDSNLFKTSWSEFFKYRIPYFLISFIYTVITSFTAAYFLRKVTKSSTSYFMTATFYLVILLLIGNTFIPTLKPFGTFSTPSSQEYINNFNWTNYLSFILPNYWCNSYSFWLYGSDKWIYSLNHSLGKDILTESYMFNPFIQVASVDSDWGGKFVQTYGLLSNIMPWAYSIFLISFPNILKKLNIIKSDY